ncbi:hypothetical protein LTS10_007287 [Elasticomyces elasticus]|nr:hypothetical protein LTS10_007287 [Elasticomyces elasticus]
MLQGKFVNQFAQAEPVHEDITAVRICPSCEGTYNSERAYNRHFGTNAHRLAIGGSLASTITCGLCDKHFTRSSDLKRHQTQDRCPSRSGAQKPPSTVLGKRKFDGMTQPLEEQKVIRRLSPIVALDESISGLHQAVSSYTAAGEASRVATHEQATLTASERLDLLCGVPKSPVEKDGIIDATSTQQEDALPTLAAIASLPIVVSHEPFEPFTDSPLYAAEAMRPPSVVVDFEWVDDLTGHYELGDLDSLQDLNGVGAIEREVGDSGSQLPTILESPAIEAGPENTAGRTKVGTNSKQEPQMSSKTRLQHILEDPVVLPLKTIRGRQPLRLRGQKCSLCKKPYEKEGVLLRQHLDSHLTEFRAEQAVHYCEACEVGFAHEKDLRHHHNIASSGGCCGLALHHTEHCKGYLCGFNFKHTAPCNGHHPPPPNAASWSDHDRSKFGHALRNWELAQLRVVAAEASQVQRLQEVARCISTLSISECGSGKQKSEASHATNVISWRSEPFRTNTEAKDLQIQMKNLNMNGSKLRQNKLELRPNEEEDLISAASTNNDDDDITNWLEHSHGLDAALALDAESGYMVSPKNPSPPVTTTEPEI